MKDVSGLLLMMVGVLMVIVDILSCGDSVCRNKRALSATADDDDDKLLTEEESVGEVWLSCES